MLLYMHARAINQNVTQTKNPPQHFLSPPSPTASKPDFSMTPADHQGSGLSLRPTTQETGRRVPVATTAPPINVLNHHHPLHRDPGRHQDLYSRGSEAQSGSSPTSSSLRDVSGQKAVDSRRTLVMQPPSKFTSTPTNTPTEVPHPTTVASSSAEATRGNKELRQDEEGTTTTTITTTTIITTMQSPGKSDNSNMVCSCACSSVVHIEYLNINNIINSEFNIQMINMGRISKFIKLNNRDTRTHKFAVWSFSATI